MSAEPKSLAATIYASWETYQGQLITALTPLTPEQLAWRPAEGLRSLGQLATHIVSVRAGWFYFDLGEQDPTIRAIAEWGEPGAPPRTAAEFVEALHTTWAFMQGCIARWTPADLAEVIEPPGEDYKITRAWVIWHLIEHDLHHGGELSYSLGIQGLPAIDI
ncbi:MAG TPA: DinB family protein [Chloroflexia bacterium]|nr:DinB family protein [Chloroflexia bacterium]